MPIPIKSSCTKNQPFPDSNLFTAPNQSYIMVPGFSLVAVGGTFDRLHVGHELMLDTAFKIGQRVLVGLSVDTVIKGKSYSKLILPYEARRSILSKFLNSRGYSGRSEILPIDDAFGNFRGVGGADKLPKLEALVVSAEPKVFRTAFKLNQARAKNNLKPICIIGVPLVEIEGKKVSSTLIRRLVVEKAGKRETSKYTNYPY